MLLFSITLLLLLSVYYRNALVSVGLSRMLWMLVFGLWLFWAVFAVNVYIGLDGII
jgi:hypothetical protein